MNILLIKPYWPYPYSKGEYTYNRIWPPLSLANCAALLEKEGHNVKILDAHAFRIVPNKVADFIKDYEKIFITSSSLDRWQCPNIDIRPFLETVRCIRQLTEEIYVIGYHGTAEPEKILNLTKAKAVIKGEPEYTVLEICQGTTLYEIKGISFNDNGKVISTPLRKQFDLKSLPVPSFHLLNFKRYYYEIMGKCFALFEISRGCHYKCRFCNKLMYGEGVRTKSKEQVLEEVTLAVEKYNVKTGYFIDLDFLSNRKIAEELCTYLINKDYKFKWTCQTRPDLLDIEILEKMKRAGCQIIHLGIESTSQNLLDYLNKDITADKVKRAVNLCKKVGMKTLGFYLFGLPGETYRDREKIYNFIKELDTDFISLHKISHFKGTAIFQNEIKLDENIDRFIRRSLIKYYLRPSYLYRLNPIIALGGFRLFLGQIRALRGN